MINANYLSVLNDLHDDTDIDYNTTNCLYTKSSNRTLVPVLSDDTWPSLRTVASIDRAEINTIMLVQKDHSK